MANLTLLDWAKRTDPDGSAPIIANLLSQTNEILTDATYVQGNLPTGHRVTVSTGLPTVYYRALNEGIPTSKATTAQVDESCAILEARSEVDIDLAMLNGNSAEFRMGEARMFIEAMNQKMASAMFYGNPSDDPKEFLGFAPRYSDLNAGNGNNILDAGGDTANEQTSVWLICWSDQSCFCPFPKGSNAGLLQEDLGRQTSFDAGGTGKRMEVMAERFQWKSGLVVKDWRYAVRIANVGTNTGETNAITNLSGSMAAGNAENILHQMMKAVARIPNLNMGRCAFYMNRTVFAGLMRTALEKSTSVLSIQDAAQQFGKPGAMLSFMGIPIRQADALVNTEAVVS
tara:strand:+ start:2708 stop:3736 length:1029 start_codon:yes stop_codon:yes gene_type:complete